MCVRDNVIYILIVFSYLILIFRIHILYNGIYYSYGDGFLFQPAMSKYKDEIFDNLKKLVAIQSVAVRDKCDGSRPFGDKSAEALEFMTDLAERLGFVTENCGNFAVHAQFGDGGDDDYAAVLCHVDVVPSGEDWHTDPWKMTEKDGFIYGRGVADDKGAAMVALYCMKAMMDNGVAMKRSIRCIFGGGEEIGMDDMQHYFSKHSLPSFAFTPDADYPACNCEKGILHLQFTGKTDPAILSLNGGDAINCVIARCTARIACENETAVRVCGKVNASGAVCSTEDGIFDVKGLSAHAMCPEKGINAASELLLALDACGVLSEGSAEYFFAKMLCGDTRGKKIGAACSDEMSGEMTVNIGTIASEDGVTSLGIDIRYPATLRSDRIISVITQTAAEYGVGVKVTSENPPLYIPCDHPLIRALGDCYTEITGQPMIPVAMGGGTSARALHGRGVAFGPVFSGSVPCNLHMADENFSVNEFMLHAEICYRAMCRLVTLENE